MNQDTVLIERHGARANLILNRPTKRNALTGPMMAALRDAVNALASDDSVHAILLHGAGGAFCAGLDLKAMNAKPRPDWLASMPTIWREAYPPEATQNMKRSIRGLGLADPESWFAKAQAGVKPQHRPQESHHHKE